MSFEVLIVLALVLGAELVNGWTDAPNAMATLIGTRSVRTRTALLLAIVFNLLGVLSGTAVAFTIGTGIVDSSAITLATVGAAMVGIIVWGSVAARWGLPTSETHALVAGLTGAGLAMHGPSALLWDGWRKVLAGVVLSTVIGFVVAHVLMRVVSRSFRRRDPARTRRVFRWLQIGSSAFVAFSHGSNDGQKFMGAFALALVLGDVLPSFEIPIWVILLCAAVMSLGTSIGGWRIISTLGGRITKLDTHHGFAAQMAAAGTITLASALGVPLSTTHTLSTAIVGVGVVDGVRAVNWRTARDLMLAWIVTFPICGAISFAAAMFTRRVPVSIQLGVVSGAAVGGMATAVLRRRSKRRARDVPRPSGTLTEHGLSAASQFVT